ncbi:MAG TPA: branched-chain amino acid ABC transporter permease [Burkholderiaceae bacterium]|nr:branched-chain amino acid ABC transporter permease [Burkholderiaceae bacterium]
MRRRPARVFQDILISGLINSSVYALLAIGFSLIFGVARIVNIAHTAFYMLGAYAFYTLLVLVGLPLVPAAVIAVVAVTAFSVLAYKLVIEPLREHVAAVLIATIALATILQELMLLAYGGHYLGVPSTLEGVIHIAGVSIAYQRFVILVVAAVMLAIVWYVLYRTKMGLAIRATANDLEIASVMGMDVGRVALATIALSVALAAVAGVIVAPVYVVDPLMWLGPLVTLLAIVVIGGLGSVKGSVIGAFVIGFVEAFTVFAVPAGAFLKGAVALTIAILVLMVRPAGLYGVAFEDER